MADVDALIWEAEQAYSRALAAAESEERRVEVERIASKVFDETVARLKEPEPTSLDEQADEAFNAARAARLAGDIQAASKHMATFKGLLGQQQDERQAKVRQANQAKVQEAQKATGAAWSQWMAMPRVTVAERRKKAAALARLQGRAL